MSKYDIYLWNVNGIRAGVKKGLITWLKNEKIDIPAIHAIKALKE